MTNYRLVAYHNQFGQSEPAILHYEKDGIAETLRGKNASLHSSGSIAVTLWSHPTVAPSAGATLNAYDT